MKTSPTNASALYLAADEWIDPKRSRRFLETWDHRNDIYKYHYMTINFSWTSLKNGSYSSCAISRTFVFIWYHISLCLVEFKKCVAYHTLLRFLSIVDNVWQIIYSRETVISEIKFFRIERFHRNCRRFFLSLKSCINQRISVWYRTHIISVLSSDKKYFTFEKKRSIIDFRTELENMIRRMSMRHWIEIEIFK